MMFSNVFDVNVKCDIACFFFKYRWYRMQDAVVVVVVGGRVGVDKPSDELICLFPKNKCVCMARRKEEKLNEKEEKNYRTSDEVLFRRRRLQLRRTVLVQRKDDDDDG